MRPISNRFLSGLIAASAVAGSACAKESTAPQAATVYFVLDAPFCGMSLPVQFLIDNAPAGTDTFRVNIPQPHLTSAAIATTAGAHVLGAWVNGGILGGYKWPNSSVTVAAGATVHDTLSFYCS